MKGREKRTTAGRRMNALVGEEEEKDKSFWGHDTWAEENDDSEFSDTEGEFSYLFVPHRAFPDWSTLPTLPSWPTRPTASSDEFDTDFNESESDEDEGEDEEAEKRIKAREKKQVCAAPLLMGEEDARENAHSRMRVSDFPTCPLCVCDPEQTKSQVYKEPKAAKPALTPEQLAEAKAKRAEAKRLAAESLMVVERSKRESTLKKSEVRSLFSSFSS